MIFDKCNLLVVKTSYKARWLKIQARRFIMNSQYELGEHLVDVGRMVLRLGPKECFFRHKRHLVRIANLRRHTKVYITNNACAIVCAKEIGSDTVLQLFFAD